MLPKAYLRSLLSLEGKMGRRKRAGSFKDSLGFRGTQLKGVWGWGAEGGVGEQSRLASPRGLFGPEPSWELPGSATIYTSFIQVVSMYQTLWAPGENETETRTHPLQCFWWGVFWLSSLLCSFLYTGPSHIRCNRKGPRKHLAQRFHCWVSVCL